MSILFSIAILLSLPLVMLLIRFARPRFAYFWIMAALGAILAWVFTLWAGISLPVQLDMAAWLPDIPFPASPALLIDQFSWPFALGLSSLILAVLLTEVARAADADWFAWASSLAVCSLGVWGVTAANPLTLLLAWGALDLAEILILIAYVTESARRERLVAGMSARVAGLLMLIWAMVEAGTTSPMDFQSIPEQVSVYLLLAAGLRLGVIPLNLPFLREPPLRRGLGTVLRLVTAAPSLMLLARAAQAGAPAGLQTLLLLPTILASLLGGISWAFADDELDGRPYWVITTGSLAVAAAIMEQPLASLAWGSATIFAGALLFLYSNRARWLNLLILFGALAISGLPGTPTWDTVHLYSAPLHPWVLLFLLVQILLVGGYIRHTLLAGQPLQGGERWVYFVYPLGLVMLILNYLLSAWLGRSPASFPALTDSWPALIVLVVLAAVLVWARRANPTPIQIPIGMRRILSLEWLYRLLWNVYRLVGRFIDMVDRILEGEGGILWTLLLLTLLVSWLIQMAQGG